MPHREPLLQVAVRHRQGPLALDVAFNLSAPWTVLFGASASGKTTILRAIQGFVRPEAGRIVLGADRLLVDRSSGVFVRPDQRGVRSAGQAARLFLNKTVRENVAFGAAAGVVDEVMALFRIKSLAGAMPDALSGGEQQRVSVARAVASASTEQALLLLDEPFAGLDFALRDVLALELKEWLGLRQVPVLSVTHDVGEVFLLGAEVIRLQHGRVVEQGPVTQVLARDRELLLGQLRA